MALTNKQRAFIEYYLTHWNATQAARLAGYSGNDATLAAMGSENLRKPNIRAEIDARLKAIAMGAEEVLARLSQQASASLDDFVSQPEGWPFFILDLDKAREKGKFHLLKKITFHEKGSVRAIELHDAQAALVHLARYHKLFDDGERVQVTVNLDVANARERLAQHLDRIADRRAAVGDTQHLN